MVEVAHMLVAHKFLSLPLQTLSHSFFFFFFDNFDLKLRRETTVDGGGDELRRLRHGGLRQRDSSDPRIRERFRG